VRRNATLWISIGAAVLVSLALAAFLGAAIFQKLGRQMAQRNLARAALSGDVAGMERALADGARVNAPVKGRPAIFWATQGGHAEAIRFLTRHGADLHYRDPQGALPLTMAVNLRKIDGLRALLEAGADPNVVNSRGFSPLQVAVSRGDVEVVRILVRGGADPHFRSSGPTPLEAARERPAILRELAGRPAETAPRGAGAAHPRRR